MLRLPSDHPASAPQRPTDAAGLPGGDDVVLVDCGGLGNLMPPRAERTIRRLVRCSDEPAVRVVAWAAKRSPEILAQAQAAGAEVWPLRARAAPCSAATSDDAFAAWLLERHGITWRRSTEAALALLAETGERSAQAQVLADRGVVPTRARGVATLRELSKALGGEEYRTPSYIAQAATDILDQLAGRRPLRWRPREAVSLEQAVRALDAEPTLATAARLRPAELADLRFVVTAIRAVRAAEAPCPGAPEAGRACQERRWAAGQRARVLGARPECVDAVAERVLVRVTDAALAVADARRDADRR